MKKFILSFLVLLALSSLATYAYWWNRAHKIPLQATEKVRFLGGESIVVQDVKNAEFESTVLGTRVKLTDGTFYFKEDNQKENRQLIPVASSTDASFIRVSENEMAFGDLDGDGDGDAALILVSATGGTGVFRELAVLRYGDRGQAQIAPLPLGDRVQVRLLAVREGTIVADITTHGPNDPLCCPTVLKTVAYKIEGEKLMEIVPAE